MTLEQFGAQGPMRDGVIVAPSGRVVALGVIHALPSGAALRLELSLRQAPLGRGQQCRKRSKPCSEVTECAGIAWRVEYHPMRLCSDERAGAFPVCPQFKRQTVERGRLELRAWGWLSR